MLLQQLGKQQAGVGKPQWQQRAQDSEYQLLQLLNTLVALPNPVPHMQASAVLPQRITGARSAPGAAPPPSDTSPRHLGDRVPVQWSSTSPPQLHALGSRP